ncbi:hypothetical protein HanHA89_Chr13g0536961 [Helianthus annuus]|nr:hypothetical protein HanHA89_Chr13g0536961 [Helianthus annuus]
MPRPDPNKLSWRSGRISLENLGNNLIPLSLKRTSLLNLPSPIRHALRRRKVPWSSRLTSQLAALRGDRNGLITNGLVGAFEYLRQSGSFTALLDRLSDAAYQSGHHDGVYKGYHECQQSGRITPEFHATKGKLQGDMADALEAACNDPLPAYDDLMKHVAEDGVDALRLMLEPMEESEEE